MKQVEALFDILMGNILYVHDHVDKFGNDNYMLQENIVN
jgi:hypothetical protein